MKLVRFGDKGKEKPGVLKDDGTTIDVSSFVNDFDVEFYTDNGLDRLAAWLKENADVAPTVPEGTRLGPPVANPGKIICVGLNYMDHAKESGLEPPAEPVLFSKAVTALSGPNDPVELPRNSVKTDWEVELAFVIGKRAKYVSKEDAFDAIAGYAIMNDVSEREFQAERCGQWVKGKSHDSFAPLGPFLATKDEIEDVGNLTLELDLNGERMQTGSTKELIFSIDTLVSYISQFMTLLPGDVISTGTPPGVGFGKKPQRYLKAGEVMDVRVQGLGAQKQEVVAPV